MSVLAGLLCLFLSAPGAELHGRSRTTVVVGASPLYSAETGRLKLGRYAPIVEELSLEAMLGAEGLQITFDAWSGIDAGERYLGERAVADLTLAFLEWRTARFQARAGRLILYSETARALHLDGGAFSVRGGTDALRLEAEAWAGVPVSTAYGDEPLRDALPSAESDPLFYAPRGSDWKRPGDLAFGTRASAAVLETAELAFGYGEERNLAVIDRRALSGRLRVGPWRTVVLDAFGSYDLVAHALEEAELALSLRAFERARVAAYGRARLPILALPDTSIFSVFAGERRAELGLEGDLDLAGPTRLSVSAELRRSALEGGGETSLGYRATAGVLSQLGFWPGARVALSYQRLLDDWFGSYDYLRWSAELPFSEQLELAPDAGLFLVKRPGKVRRFAGRLGLAGSLHLYPGLALVLAGRASEDQAGVRELALIGRIEWAVEHSF